MQARLVFAVIAAGALFGMGSCSSSQEGASDKNGNGGSSATGGSATGGAQAGTGNTCAPGTTLCGSSCANTLVDNLNCGVCANVCPPGTSCGNSQCACQPGTNLCGTQCVNFTADITNCGQCGNNCGLGALCNVGQCACLPGYGVCGTGTAAHCVNTTGDASNCGTCGNVCPATAPFCQAGMCSASCTLTTCGTLCVNTMSDQANCGACGNACAPGQMCTNSVCGCPTGQGSCGTSGACIDTTSNALNCGACGVVCSGGRTCTGGTCACPTGSVLCGDACMAGTTCGTGGMGGMGGSATGGTGGAGAGAGGAGSGSGGATGRPPGCTAPTPLLSDFEEGPQARLVPAEGRTGWWYVFGQTGGSQTPPNVMSAPIVAELLNPAEGMCNRYALHSTASGKPQYSGFGATMNPTGTTPNAKGPVSLANYTGISFRIRSGSGSNAGVFFEFLNRETQPGPNCSTCGANSDLGGTATNNAIDAYNTRGRRLPAVNTSGSMMGAQQFTLNFGTLAPRYLPSGTTCPSNAKCEAPAFSKTSVLGIQFSTYDQFSTSGSYDLWVDDVTLTTGDAGLPAHAQTAGATHPFPRDAAVPNCTKPSNALGKYLIEAYQTWKQTFVEPNPGAGLTAAGTYRVKRPEASNDTVSEGIGYGMLIAVYMNDRNLFDGLWAYWKQHLVGGTMLMNWQITSGGGTQGAGSATDADEDAAFALIMASRQWSGGTYAADANTVINNIYTNEVASGGVLKPGNSFGGADLTNPSYFAPAFYRVFDTFESTNHDWAAVISSTYTYLNAIKGTYGLVPAWCSNSCGTAGGGGYMDADKYQYDSHRTPWRIGLDACWNNEARAKSYVAMTTSFFSGASDTEGLGALADMYFPTGGKFGTKANSMSLIGTAATGAMAGGTGQQAYLDRSFQFLLDAMYTPDPMTRLTAYTYYNATVGFLTALTLSGNFNNW